MTKIIFLALVVSLLLFQVSAAHAEVPAQTETETPTPVPTATNTPQPTVTPIPEGTSGQDMAHMFEFYSGLDVIIAALFGLSIVGFLATLVHVLMRL